MLAQKVVLRDKNPVEFANIHENLIDEFQPQGPLEEQLLENVAVCLWRPAWATADDSPISTADAWSTRLDTLGRVLIFAAGWPDPAVHVEEIFPA